MLSISLDAPVLVRARRIFSRRSIAKQLFLEETKMSILNFASNKFFDDDDYALSAVAKARLA